MNNRFKVTVLLIGLILTNKLLAWGFEPHRKINQQACLLLPNQLYTFYKKHINYMMQHATDADMRRYIDTLEGGRHFIDLEHYGNHVDSIPTEYLMAEAKFGALQLQTEGQLPWNIVKKVYQLKSAFKQGDQGYILKLSADLGHYIGDAHVPLHTTANYNGQLSGQHGIHALWETQTPKLFLDTILVPMIEFHYHTDWIKRIFQTVQESHDLLPWVLHSDSQVRIALNESQWYEFQQNNQRVAKSYSEKYVRLFHEKLDHMVEERFVASAQLLAQLIYTAWVMAGEPPIDIQAKVLIDGPNREFSNQKIPESTDIDCNH